MSSVHAATELKSTTVAKQRINVCDHFVRARVGTWAKVGERTLRTSTREGKLPWSLSVGG